MRERRRICSNVSALAVDLLGTRLLTFRRAYLAMTPGQFRDGIFALFTVRFGNVAEIMVKRLGGLNKARSRFHDLFDDMNKKRVEVKFSRVLRKHDTKVTINTVVSCIDEARGERRALTVSEASREAFDSNIQQIKCSEFDILYYGLFFRDKIVVFRADSATVEEMPGYSNFQHKGNENEGQFHINEGALAYHMRNHKHLELDYADLLNLLTAP